MQTLITSFFLFVYATAYIFVGFIDLPFKNFLFPRVRLELLFSEPHAEIKGRIALGGTLQILCVVGAIRGLYLMAFGPPWAH